VRRLIMKQTPELDMAQARMKPRVLSLPGHMGTDTRKLIDVLTDDAAEVQRLGMTHESIAARMKDLRDKGARGLGLPLETEEGLEVTVDSYRGRIPCPFKDRSCTKTNTTVRDVKTGETVTYTDAGIHMIEAHGFYEGRGSPYRLEPAVLVRLLRVRRTEEK